MVIAFVHILSVRCLCDIYVIFSDSYKDLEFLRRDPKTRDF